MSTNMSHVYENGDGERIAANTMGEAAHYLECLLGGAATFNSEDWTQLDDDELLDVTGVEENDPDKVTTKTAREWAAEHAEPGYVSSTYA